DGGTITRPPILNLTVVHWRAVEIRPDQVVNRWTRINHVAEQLRLIDFFRSEAERPWIGVTRLLLHSGEINCPAIESARCSRFKSGQMKTGRGQTAAQDFRCIIPRPAALTLGFPSVHDRLQKSPGCEDYCPSQIQRLAPATDANDPAVG